MSYADDLLALASSLIATKNEAAFRRSMSTSYYAVFHLLVEAAIARLVPATDGQFAQNLARRAPTHTQLKHQCKQLVPQPKQKAAVVAPKRWKDAGYADAIVPELQDLAALVVELHTYRELADYDLGAAATELGALTQHDRAEQAFKLVGTGVKEPQWTLFLVSLLLPQRREE